MFMIKMLLRNLRRRFFNYGTIMKTFTKAERRLNKYRGEMIDEAAEFSIMISTIELARQNAEKEAGKAIKGLKALSNFFGD